MKMAINTKFDIQYINSVEGIRVKHLLADVMHMSYLLNPVLGTYGYKLKPTAAQYTELGAYDTEVHVDDPERDALEHGGLTIWERIPMSELGSYNSGDCDATFRLYYVFLIKIREYKMQHVLQIMADGCQMLAEMEANGVLIDSMYVKEKTPELEAIVKQYEADLFTLVGREIDWNSPKEIAKLLYDDLKYIDFVDAKTFVKKKKGKGPKLRDTGELTLLRYDTPITKAVLRHRRASKLLSTYFKGYFSNPEVDGRIHPNFSQTGTATGRLSSDNPNFQNIAKKIEKSDPAYNELKNIQAKLCIVAPTGWKIVSADLSQAELRVAAMASRDPALCKVFIDDVDLHSMNAKNSFGIRKNIKPFVEEALSNGLVVGTPEFDLYVLRKELRLIKDENSDQRSASKSISFGILYSMTKWGLSYDLTNKTRSQGKIWSPEECGEAIDNFHRAYPKLTRYMTYCKTFAKKNGYIYNLFGRRRWFPNITSDDYDLRKRDLNGASNTPIQGGSSDLMICGMVAIWKEIDHSRAKMIMTVHDSLVLEVREDYVDECAKIVKRNLEHPTFRGKPLEFINIPIKADIEIGDSYGHVKEIEVEY